MPKPYSPMLVDFSRSQTPVNGTSRHPKTSIKIWLDCNANDHFVSERSVLKKHESLERKLVDTCAGKGRIIWKDDATFTLRGITLKCKFVPEIGKNLTTLSETNDWFEIIFSSVEKFNGYEIVHRETGRQLLASEFEKDCICYFDRKENPKELYLQQKYLNFDRVASKTWTRRSWKKNADCDEKAAWDPYLEQYRSQPRTVHCMQYIEIEIIPTSW